MYNMTYDITIGSYRLRLIDKVTIRKSVERLCDEAIITLPASVYNVALQIEDKINIGDVVEVKLGYNDIIQTEFKGYLKTVRTDAGSITLECIDELYLWDKSLRNEEIRNISVKELLCKVASQVDASYNIECDYDYSYEKFTIYKATGLDVLKKIQDEIKANIYFEEKTLHIHPPYSNIGNNKAIVLDFARNIESANLKYVREADRKIEVEIELRKPNGEVVKKTYGTPGGKKINRTISGGAERNLDTIAKSEYDRWNYDGYEGSVTCWLYSIVQPADKVEIKDDEYEYKRGVYYVLGTDIEFSSSGAKRVITLGKRMQ